MTISGRAPKNAGFHKTKIRQFANFNRADQVDMPWAMAD